MLISPTYGPFGAQVTTTARLAAEPGSFAFLKELKAKSGVHAEVLVAFHGATSIRIATLSNREHR